MKYTCHIQESKQQRPSPSLSLAPSGNNKPAWHGHELSTQNNAAQSELCVCVGAGDSTDPGTATKDTPAGALALSTAPHGQNMVTVSDQNLTQLKQTDGGLLCSQVRRQCMPGLALVNAKAWAVRHTRKCLCVATAHRPVPWLHAKSNVIRTAPAAGTASRPATVMCTRLMSRTTLHRPRAGNGGSATTRPRSTRARAMV